MRPNQDLLDLLLEIQSLDRVPRLGYSIRGVADPESVTEHSWQVLFLVWVLSERIDGIDPRRALEIALVHDLAEVRLGDLPRTASRYLPAGSKSSAERAALADILAPLPDSAHELIAEYQAGRSPEARLVKACDKLQLMLKVAVYESWGHKGLERFWDNPDNFLDGDFAIIRDLYTSLRDRRERGASLARE